MEESKLEYIEENSARVVPYGKNKIRVERKDPYGFWYVSFERGSPPERLKGSYTTYRDAEKDITVFLASKEAAASKDF